MVDSSEEMLEGLPRPGATLAGKYRIDRVLGVGGMGVVVAATHLQLGEQVAIKFLAGSAARDRERVTRFIREAWAATKIKNEHVARVSDVAKLDDGTAYLVMEFLEGTDLEAVLRHGGLPVATAVDYVLQAAEALAEAHKLGIVHRDLKPANLFLTHRADGSPCIKVLDFGISKFAGGASLTQPTSLMGSPLYMAPEQLLSAADVDARVDVWSLGVILYELVAGRPPFEVETMSKLIGSILEGKARPLRELAPHVSPEFERALMRCLATDRAARYRNVAEMAEALVDFGSQAARASAAFAAGVLLGRPVSPSPAAAANAPTSGAAANAAAVGLAPTVAASTPRPGAETHAPVSTAAAHRRRRRVGWWVAAAAVSATALGAGAIVWVAASAGTTSTPASEVSSEPETFTTEASSDPESRSATGAGRVGADGEGAADSTAVRSASTGAPSGVPAPPPAASASAAPAAAIGVSSRSPSSPPRATGSPSAAPTRTPRPSPTRTKPWNPYADR